MTSYEPDTPENRKLFYAIRRGDPQGVQKALAAGASVDALRGYHNQPDTSTLLEAVRASRQKKEGPAEVARLLLEAGAKMDARSPGGGIPMIWATAFPHRGEVLRAMIDHAGGLDAFAERFSPALGQELLLKVHPLHLENQTVASVFFRVWDRTPEAFHPKSSLEGVPWIWTKSMAWQAKVSSDVLEQVEARCPRPTPQRLGHRLWVAWLERLNVFAPRSTPFLLRDGLERTPAHWWAKVPEPAEGETDPPSDYTLVDKLLAVSHPRPLVVRALSRAVKALPGGWKHPHAPNPSVVLRASATSVATLRGMLKIMPPGDHQEILTGALRDVLFSGLDPHHRQSRVSALLELGADPTQPGEDGNTALHLASKWNVYNKNYIRQIVQMLLDKGARLDAPENQEGKTAYQVLEENSPGLASEFLSQEMDAEIPQAPQIPAIRPKARF